MHELTTVAHLRYPTHWVFVFSHQVSGRTHCIKYNSQCVEWEEFESDESLQLSEYIIRDLPSGRWCVCIDGEDVE